MDLALHLGMTEAGLRRSMSEHELQRWGLYAQRKQLPLRSIQLLLAQIALMVAKTMGNARDATLEDFLFDPPPIDAPLDDDGDAVPDVDELAAFFGAKVVSKG